MKEFLNTLRTQRWDDHRYYHHSRINQALHLVSAVSFLCAYVVAFFDPAVAALIAWMVAMTTRQTGHFFFEPKGYDAVNRATHEHKEAIKVGYNLHRKIVLLAIWAAAPVLLAIEPTLFGAFVPATTAWGFIHQVGQVWFVVGAGGLVFRAVQLTLTQGAMTAVVWVSKILTDPFHDIMLYHKAPMQVLRREFFDPALNPMAAALGEDEELLETHSA